MVKYNVVKPYFGKMPKTIERDNVEDAIDDVEELAKPLGIPGLEVINRGETIDFRFGYKGKNRRFLMLERVYRPLDKDIDRLNSALERNGRPRIGTWLATQADLRRAIDYEEGQLPRRPDPRRIADIMDALKMGRTADGKLHYSIPLTKLPPAVARGAYATKTEAKIATGRTPHKPNTTRRESPTTKTVLSSARVSAAAILIELGIDPRKGRAMLRKANVDRTDANAIRTYFKEKL